jgi:hypothetical protein
MNRPMTIVDLEMCQVGFVARIERISIYPQHFFSQVGVYTFEISNALGVA